MPYRKTNFHQALQTHSVILLNKMTQGIGTGILIQHSGQYFVLTAWHVIKDTDHDLILVHLGISGQRYPMKKERIWYDASVDLAYIQLNKFEAQTFLNRISPIRLGPEIARDVVKERLRCAICGYPGSMSYFDEPTKTVKAETLLVTTVPIPPEQWPIGITEDGKDPARNFILKYGSKRGGAVRNQEGEPIEPTDPHGLSGAAVWVYDPNTENNEKPGYALFGIQTGIYEREQVLVGSFVKPLLDQIRHDYRLETELKVGRG